MVGWVPKTAADVNPHTVRRVSVSAVLLVALVAATCSYAHLYELAVQHGEGWRASLIPLSIDGMLVAATLAIVTQRRHNKPAGWVPWLGLTLGIVASLLGNVAAAHPDVIARLIASWPPVALAISIETLVVILRTTVEVETPKPAPKPAVKPPLKVNKPEAEKAPTTETREQRARRLNKERQQRLRDQRKKQKPEERNGADVLASLSLD